MSDARPVEVLHPLPETVSDFQMPRFNRPSSLQRGPFEPMAVRIPKEKGPMVKKMHYLPYIGYVTDPEFRGMMTRLGITVGTLATLAATAFFILRAPEQNIIQTQPQITTAAPERVTSSALENQTFLEDFLFEGFTKEEKVEASKRIAFFMTGPSTITDLGRNIVQNIQGISSEDLRPMDENILRLKVLKHVAEAMPQGSLGQTEARTRLLMAMFKQESGFRPGVINLAENATGLGQPTPLSFKEVLKRFKIQAEDSPTPENSIYAKYFSDIQINLKSKKITPEEETVLIKKLKDPDINILVCDELLRLYTEHHSSLTLGLMAYGSKPTALAQAEFDYANLVGEIPLGKLVQDFKGVDEEGEPDPTKPPATIVYTELFKLNPINLKHPAVTGALSSAELDKDINWDYPWIIVAQALGNNPDDFPAIAQTTNQSPS